MAESEDPLGDEIIIAILRLTADLKATGHDPLDISHALIAGGAEELAQNLRGEDLADHLALAIAELRERETHALGPRDLNQHVRAIIDGAIADMEAIGAEHREACKLLAVQGIVRLGVDDTDALATVKRFADESYAASISSEGETIQ